MGCRCCSRRIGSKSSFFFFCHHHKRKKKGGKGKEKLVSPVMTITIDVTLWPVCETADIITPKYVCKGLSPFFPLFWIQYAVSRCIKKKNWCFTCSFLPLFFFVVVVVCLSIGLHLYIIMYLHALIASPSPLPLLLPASCIPALYSLCWHLFLPSASIGNYVKQ